MSIDLTVSVVTYNSAWHVPELLASMARQTGVSWELRVADNASGDGSAELFAGARVRRNADNVGFARAHNQNLRDALGRHVLILNPDVEFEDGLFAALVRALDDNAHWGIAGPSIYEDADRRLFAPRRYCPGEGMLELDDRGREEHRLSYMWVSGACMAVRREVWERIGGFDERFFLYSEDVDLCLRTRRAGWDIGWVEDAEVWHTGFGSQHQATPYERARKLFEGAARLWEIHYPPEAVRAMMRFQLAVAGAVSAVAPRGSSARDPLHPERLRARRDVAREWLTNAGAHGWPVGAYMGRILARQVAIVWQWMREGRWPLDDY